MKDKILIFAIALAGGLAGANVQPVLTGAGKLLFPESSTPATISASSGALAVAAGGSNQNVILKPTGSGCVQVLADSPAITLCDSSGQLTINAGGSNKNIVLSPSGTGSTSLNGYALANAGLRVLGTFSPPPASGAGLEFQGVSGAGQISAYDRAASAWKTLNLDGSPINLGANSFGNVFIGGGSATVYRCLTAGISTLAGVLTITAADCGTSTDTGLRVK